MPIPITESLVNEMAVRIATCKLANGYTGFEVTNVLRLRLDEDAAYAPGVVQLACGDIVQTDERNKGSSHAVEYTFEIVVSFVVQQAADAIEPMETTVARASRDLHHAIDVTDRLGIAELLTLKRMNSFGASGGMAGGNLVYEARVVMSERDLSTAN